MCIKEHNYEFRDLVLVSLVIRVTCVEFYYPPLFRLTLFPSAYNWSACLIFNEAVKLDVRRKWSKKAAKLRNTIIPSLIQVTSSLTKTPEHRNRPKRRAASLSLREWSPLSVSAWFSRHKTNQPKGVNHANEQTKGGPPDMHFSPHWRCVLSLIPFVLLASLVPREKKESVSLH